MSSSAKLSSSPAREMTCGGSVSGAEAPAAPKRAHQVRAVADLCFLRLRRQHDQLGGRVRNLKLLHDGGGVAGDEQLVQVVDDHLVHSCAKQRRVGGLSTLLQPGATAAL